MSEAFHVPREVRDKMLEMQELCGELSDGVRHMCHDAKIVVQRLEHLLERLKDDTVDQAELIEELESIRNLAAEIRIHDDDEDEYDE
jgi:hypothetical protein